MENLEDRICRSCMTKLLDVKYGLLESVGLSERYRRFSSTHLRAEDHLPKFICLSCYRQLESFDSFQKMCIESCEILTDRFAFNIFKEEIFIKEETSETNSNKVVATVSRDHLEIAKLEDEWISDLESGRDPLKDVVEAESEAVSSDKLLIEIIGQERVCIKEKTNNKKAKTEAKEAVDEDTKTISKKPGFPFTCALCSRYFLKKDTYERHLRVHQGLKPYACKLCKKEYKHPSVFKAHMLSEHTDNPETFPCTIEECNKVFKSKRVLQHHLYCHTNRDKNKSSTFHESICDVCGKVFSSRGSLKKHKLIHNNEYPSECDICQMRFRNSFLLNTHKIKKHDADSKYQCHICGAKKTSGAELRYHIAVHLDIRKHICEICSKKFRTKCNLNEHIQTVHVTVKRFACSHCDKCFTMAKKLSKHLKIHQKSLEKKMHSSHNERLK